MIAHRCLKAEEAGECTALWESLKSPIFADDLMCCCSEIADAANYHHSDGCLVLLHFSNYSQLANLILLPRLLLELSYFIIYNYIGIVNENNPAADSVIYNLSNCRFSLISYYLPNLCCAEDCYYCHLFKKWSYVLGEFFLSPRIYLQIICIF